MLPHDEMVPVGRTSKTTSTVVPVHTAVHHVPSCTAFLKIFTSICSNFQYKSNTLSTRAGTERYDLIQLRSFEICRL